MEVRIVGLKLPSADLVAADAGAGGRVPGDAQGETGGVSDAATTALDHSMNPLEHRATSSALTDLAAAEALDSVDAAVATAAETARKALHDYPLHQLKASVVRATMLYFARSLTPLAWLVQQLRIRLPAALSKSPGCNSLTPCGCETLPAEVSPV